MFIIKGKEAGKAFDYVANSEEELLELLEKLSNNVNITELNVNKGDKHDGRNVAIPETNSNGN